jgi:UDP-GlcNAc3NAcA epimerase
MIQLLTVIGARPQIIKAAAFSRAVKNHSDVVSEHLLHTGQHYDANMSQVFFDELQIPKPTYQLHSGSGSHGTQTAKMIQDIEGHLLACKPHAVVVYGDTNSTLAAAVAASKLQIPIVHIEAGLRSFNKTMPEEINRILCDHVSSFMYVPTQQGMVNLEREGFNTAFEGRPTADQPRIRHSGDVMYDNALYFSQLAQSKIQIMDRLGLEPGSFILATLHRNQNTDDAKRLSQIFTMLLEASEQMQKKVVMPLHPRTRKMMPELLSPELNRQIKNSTQFQITEPVSFLEMIALERHCSIVCTDSGGVQKEAYFFKKPCIIFRPETEWVELVELQKAFICDADPVRFHNACKALKNNTSATWPSLYGDGQAAAYILKDLLQALS